MCGENMERPSPDANSAQKARWSLCQAMSGQPEGVPVADLIRKVQSDWPGEFDEQSHINRIRAALHNMHRARMVEQVGRGVWACANVSEMPETAPAEEVDEPAPQLEAPQLEVPLYPMVKDQLVNSLDACTRAEIVGGKGNIGGGTFATPDVVGIIAPTPTARHYGFHNKILAVEVKSVTNPQALLVGYAQASAYLDFAHMALLVVPWCHGPNIDRVTRLCEKNGIGLAFIRDEDGEKWLEMWFPPRSQQPAPKQLEEFIHRLNMAGIDLG